MVYTEALGASVTFDLMPFMLNVLLSCTVWQKRTEQSHEYTVANNAKTSREKTSSFKSQTLALCLYVLSKTAKRLILMQPHKVKFGFILQLTRTCVCGFYRKKKIKWMKGVISLKLDLSGSGCVLCHLMFLSELNVSLFLYLLSI